jgi:hypothetical protein
VGARVPTGLRPLCVAAALGCGHTYVGKLSGSDAYIAIVTNGTGDQAGGYVCDSKKVSLWIGKSPLGDGQGKLLARRDGAPVGSVEIAGGGATGEVTIAGSAHAFSAEAASGDAGLHHATQSKSNDVTVETGWVVLADGSFRGIRKTSTTTTTASKPSAVTTVGWVDPDTQPWTDPDTQP